MNELTLNKAGLGTLKNIAHELGVPGSKSHTKYTKKNKDELIQQILKFQKMGDTNKSDSSDDEIKIPKRKLQKPPEDDNQIYMLLAVVGAGIVGASLYNQQKSVVENKIEVKQSSPQKHVVEQSPKASQVAQAPGIYSF